MEKSDEDKDDDDDEVNFLNIQRNLKSYSQKKLVSLANVFIDAYHNLINDKNILTEKLGEVDHERDNLLVVVIDLKETIEDFKKEKYVIIEKIEKVEHWRDDLLVVVVDIKNIIEDLKKDNNSIKASIENCINSSKGKELATKAHIKLENKLKRGVVKGSNQRWNMSNSFCKHMTRSTDYLLSLKDMQSGSMSFGNGKQGYILEVVIIRKTFTHSIEITNLVTGEVVLVAKRFKNIYVADFKSLNSRDLTYFSVVNDDAELWHRRLGHANFPC
ncbi:uncharacterized protein [Nicotiana sylvestris]|uniref:uncharacterized protein n=1 Tax=Nicotiana sylvestris TaxID=4096 RepID=UPI00388CA6B7